MKRSDSQPLVLARGIGQQGHQRGQSVIIIILLVWLGSAAVCYAIAKNKGHDPLMWGLIGFFLGPLAILFIAIAHEKEGAVAIGETKRCPNCAETIRAEARVCRYCNTEFDEAELQRQAEERELDALERDASLEEDHRRNLKIVGVVLAASIGSIVLLFVIQ